MSEALSHNWVMWNWLDACQRCGIIRDGKDAEKSCNGREPTAKDSDGNKIQAGDKISFSYGIPPVRVIAKVVQRGRSLIAIVPEPHKPSECNVKTLKKYVDFYRTHNEGERDE